MANEKQIEALAKAREAKKIKQSANTKPDINPSETLKDITYPAPKMSTTITGAPLHNISSSFDDKWFKIFIVYMQNLQVRASGGVQSAVIATNETVALLKSQGKL